MKQVFQTEDGSVHQTAEAASKRERLLESVSNARKLLPLGDNEYSNGSGYYQLTQQEVGTFKTQLRELIKINHPDLIKIYDKCPEGIIGRYLCDSDSPIYSLYCTLICIDSSNKMWGQPYFACNPGSGKQINLRKND